ncbi:glycosyltransferase family 2 protein [Aestuariirhabdus litorea]|uniref:Glycosyltransferase family 2 protein n=1 Tax=Aestuariirhabdus litorea TaxID=2528527 RepID=A0A3P3VX04_9GAMM|nr:glycosyltransferase family 2 protein [Aestuariirhabdus litorea]RRJ85233.1 glycosyltransferase family 2 protein [Aestuariirhabdus litorea]RWW98453.1 glycosyltransferase [Endozoicomonadaceae bacterium GTF-13]
MDAQVTYPDPLPESQERTFAGEVAVVIPAFHEARTIASLVTRALAYVDLVIVVDDGSRDRTAELAREAGARVLLHERRMGKAAALRSGFGYALGLGAEAVISLDGDGQHNPDEIPRLLRLTRYYPGALLMGARLKDSELAPRARKRANQVADFWISWAAGTPLLDTQCGFRLYPRPLLERFARGQELGSGFVFESAILIEAVRAGFGVVALPIHSLYQPDARPSHFRPVWDITLITLMVSIKLLQRGLMPLGLWRSLTRVAAVGSTLE